MAGDGVERRLAAILCTDVVGYGQLMEVDEEATIRASMPLKRNLAIIKPRSFYSVR